MIIKKSVVLVVAILFCFIENHFGQKSYGSSVDFLGGDMIFNVPLKPQEYAQTYYLDDAWNEGSIMLLDTTKVIRGYPIKYDLINGIIEIRSHSGIRYIEDYKVKAFQWLDKKGEEIYFINSQLFGVDVDNAVLQVLVNGKAKLFKETNIRVVNNEVVNYGVTPSLKTVSITRKFYLSRNERIIEIRNKKRDVLRMLNDKRDKILSYSKENNLSFRKEAELMKIVEYYNSII